jgi:hypothetical protein
MHHFRKNVRHKCAIRAPQHNRKWRIDVASQVTDRHQFSLVGRPSPPRCSASSTLCCIPATRKFIDVRAFSALLRACSTAALPSLRIRHLNPGLTLIQNQAMPRRHRPSALARPPLSRAARLALPIPDSRPAATSPSGLAPPPRRPPPRPPAGFAGMVLPGLSNPGHPPRRRPAARPLLIRGHEFPRSHGPAKDRVNGPRLTPG